MKGITKLYGSLYANNEVDLTLRDGEVLAVVGENGAGKTTLMKILYGLEQPSSGEIYLDGKLQKLRSPMDAIKLGIGMVQQHFMLFPEFTVAENIVYGGEPGKHKFFFDRAKAEKIVEELSRKYLLQVPPSALIRECPVGLQQRVEIVKVLYHNADIIILDEPSAVLTPLEVEELFKTIRQLVSFGKSVIIITHKLNEVIAIADRVQIMRGGRKIQEMNTADTSIEELSRLMVGRDIINKVVPPQETGEVVLEIQDLHHVDSRGAETLKGLSMHIKGGEIVGIAGVSGNGQSALVECIMGLAQPSQGSIMLQNQNIVGKTVDQIRAAGSACIPEDRYKHGCAAEATLIETGLMGHQQKDALSHSGILDSKKVRGFIGGLLSGYDVQYSDMQQKAGELSGGNIQKLIVAREIENNTPFLIAAEPTRGVDIGAMEFIHDTLLKKRQEKEAILLISSELTEIRKLCDRIYTIYDGKLNGEFTRENATEEILGIHMMGGTLHEV